MKIPIQPYCCGSKIKSNNTVSAAVDNKNKSIKPKLDKIETSTTQLWKYSSQSPKSKVNKNT